MPKNKTISIYRSGKQNCAQSLYSGFQELLQVPGETIDSARKLGGGRADEGRMRGAAERFMRPWTLHATKRRKNYCEPVLKNSRGRIFAGKLRTGSY